MHHAYVIQGADKLRTLVIGVNWLGDTVMSMPALLSIVAASPGHEFHVAAPEALTALIAMAAPVKTIGWSRKDSTSRRIQRIKGGRYNRVIVFPNSFRSAWIARRAGIPERWGYAGGLRGWLLNRSIPKSQRPKAVHQSQHYMEIVRRIGGERQLQSGFLVIPQSVLGWADARVRQTAGERPLVGISPGAHYGPAKRWNPDRFTEVARTIRRRYGAEIVLVGDQKDRAAAQEMGKGIGDGVLDLRGRTNLEQLAAVLDRCALLICNDSGPMHVASAVGTPVVALFGSTDPIATGPMGPHRIVRANSDCSPCLKRRCPENTYRCLEAIRPDAVLAAVGDLLR